MIKKELKNVRFTYSDKVFKIIRLYATGMGEDVELSKTETFSFVRFAVRIFQREFRRRK